MRKARDVNYAVGRDETLDLIIAEVKHPLVVEIERLVEVVRQMAAFNPDVNTSADLFAIIAEARRALWWKKDQDAAPGA